MKLIAGIILFLAESLTVQAAPSAPPAPPKPRPLLLLSPLIGEKLVVRATAATVQGDILSAETEDGHRAGWNRTALVVTLPWYTDAELASRGVNLPALVDVYDRTAREHPEFRAGLAAEVTRMRTSMAALAQDRKEKLAAVLSFRYDPANPYTPEELRQRIQAADAVAAIAPEEEPDIAKAVAPLRDHLANLEAGQTFFEHQWRTPEAVRKLNAQAAESAHLNAYSAGLQIPLDAQVRSAGRVNAVLAVIGIAAGAVVALGMGLVFRRRFLPGAVLVLLPVLGGGYYATLLSSKDVAWPTVSDPSKATAGSVAVAKMIETATKKSASSDEPQLHVREADVNDFLATHMALQGTPVAGAVNLQRVEIKFMSGVALVCETAEWRGYPLRIQYVYHTQNTASRIIVSDAGVRIGNAPVPNPVMGWLRSGLVPVLAKFFTAHDLLANYTLTPVADGSIDLLASAPTPAPIAEVVPPPPPPAAETLTPTPPPAPTVLPPTPAAVARVVAEANPEPPENDKADLPPLSAVGVNPGPDNTFYIYAIWDGINSASDHEIEEQMDRLRDQFGKGNRFHRIGFAFILGGNENRLQTVCSIARRKDLAIGVILGAQTHSGAGKHEVQEDFHAVQWRLNGQDWRGGDGARDAMLPTPSRYCKPVRDALEKTQRARCDMLQRVMQSHPGVITCINSTIVEELADGGQTDDDKLADYSPFAVTEFRDWLRHTGEYDADGGKYAGQGAPEEITGPYVFAKSKPRSPFYAAETPDTSLGNSNFNQRFSTHFKTWALRYWDLQAYPGKITDDTFNPTPESGVGFTEGGFDAPCKRDASSWWHAWSWDYQDNGNHYPPGKADAPAFGFRQAMVHHFVEDMFQVAIRARLPATLMFAHQIPGETAGAPRDRSAATPTWTAYLPFNGTVGVTRFGFFDPGLALHYTKANPESRGWGIFEWHPKPNADPNDPEPYQTATDNLRTYYRARCHHLFAGWWYADPAKQTKDFPLADSQFAKAIKDFIDSRPDQPYPGMSH